MGLVLAPKALVNFQIDSHYMFWRLAVIRLGKIHKEANPKGMTFFCSSDSTL